MGFLSDIEKLWVIQKSASRLSLPENTDSVYTLLDAIKDHRGLYGNEPVKSQFSIFSMFGDDQEENNLAQIQREAYYSYIQKKALKASSSSIVFEHSFMKAVYAGFTDYRKSECQIVYQLPLLILVIMMAHNCGITDADAIASYYRKHCLEFYIQLGGVPPLTNRLRASTIRTVMILPDKVELEKFFLEYF